MTKRKSFAEAAKNIAPAPAVVAPTSPAVSEDKPVEYRKFTVPLRADQLNGITQVLARLTVEHDVVVTKALLIRLAIDEVLEQLRTDPDDVIARLYNLERQELEDNEDRRVSMSRGIEAHLHSVGRL